MKYKCSLQDSISNLQPTHDQHSETTTYRASSTALSSADPPPWLIGVNINHQGSQHLPQTEMSANPIDSNLFRPRIDFKITTFEEEDSKIRI